MIRSAFWSGLFFGLTIFSGPQAIAQETVNNPDIVMDLHWEIGSWTDICRVGQFESAAANSDVS